MEKDMEKTKKILIVVTNTSDSGDLHKTGVWLEEFAVPYYAFQDEGYEVTVASPLGGVAPIDENSLECKNPTEWDYTKKYLDNTKKLDEVDYKTYDAIFIPGGHGPMFDLAQNELLGEIVSYFYNTHKPVAALCHGPAGLINAKTETNEPIVKGMRLTSFTNEEEKIIKKDKMVPFLLESKLRQIGALFEDAAPWSEHVVVDENLITGQNPASAKLTAEHTIKKLKL
ncbi:putative peptidase C56 family protein [Clostridium sp. CAG:306]|nr:putative peptidase C56 family protein [Clostridium sp. CAG:306]